MANSPILERLKASHPQRKDEPKAGPSGATDNTQEREKKFDEEGGAQPHAKSEREISEELKKNRNDGQSR
jgi:hypothetical protein